VAWRIDSPAPFWRQAVSLQSSGNRPHSYWWNRRHSVSARCALLAEGLAQEHRWGPNSGWITFQVQGEDDFKHALWLMRLSYFRYRLRTVSDPRRRLDEESEELQLSPS